MKKVYFYLICYFLCGISGLAQQIQVIGGDRLICEGDKLHLVSPINDSSYIWITVDYPDSVLSTSFEMIDYPTKDTEYILITSNDTLSIEIEVEGTWCYCQYYTPNIFTPDGDAFNEHFFPIINCEIIGQHTTIYNRDQRIVFDSHELEAKWNGRYFNEGEVLDDGIYIYQISFQKLDGEVIRLIGHIYLTK